MKIKYFVFIVSLFFYGCYSDTVQNQTMEKEKNLFKGGIQTIEHEGCEYIYLKSNSHGDVEIIHKQNCRFCLERK